RAFPISAALRAGRSALYAASACNCGPAALPAALFRHSAVRDHHRQGCGDQADRLGVGKYLLLALCVLVTACSVVLPYVMLAIVSISKSWGNPLSWENMTLSHYGALFVSGGIARRALINSLFLAVSAATLAALLTAALATIVERTDFRARGLVAFIAMVPFAVPGIALGVAMMWAYISPPIALYGTIWILLVTYVTKWVPLGFMSARLSLKQMSSEFEEAARNLGATWTYAFAKV